MMMMMMESDGSSLLPGGKMKIKGNRPDCIESISFPLRDLLKKREYELMKGNLQNIYVYVIRIYTHSYKHI